MESLGVYISVPFCRAKCSFCNFASGAIGSGEFGAERIEGYVDRVCAEMRSARSRAASLGGELPELVDSVYLGGGTPSLLEPAQLGRIFEALRAEFRVAKDAEITLECAPGQIAAALLHDAPMLGVNRISFGVQSFVDRETAAVGRLHTAEHCLAEIARVRQAGLKEISVDLIAGLPRQTASSWEISLAAVAGLEIPHVSVYMLEVDEDSRLGKELIAGGPRYQAATIPSDEAMADFYARACEVFEAAGLDQYEISNFARNDHRSRHNLKYWRRDPYLGFGVDAHSMLRRGAGGVRWANTDDLSGYMERADVEVTEVGPSAAFEEAVFLGLRMNDGVDLLQLERQFGAAAMEACAGSMQDMTNDGLICRLGDRVALTSRGREVSNEVFGELLRGVAA